MRVPLFLLLGLFILPFGAHAMSLDLTTNASSTDTSHVTVHLSLRPDGTSVNALAGDLVIPDGLSIRSVRYGSSVVPYWIELPSTTGQRITFAGMIPGGTTSAGEVLSIDLAARTTGEYTIALGTTTQVLRNDGLGTAAPFANVPLTLHMKAGSAALGMSPQDTTPPQPFTPVISKSNTLYDGDYFAAFNTTDRESGLSHYEIAEVSGFPLGIIPTHFRRVASPARLIDQSRTSSIYVRAVDQAGNIRTEVLWPSQIGVVSLAELIALLLLAAFGVWFWWKLSRRKSVLPVRRA